jgi:hypothetical protein
MTPVSRYPPIWIALLTLACIGILIWVMILSRPKPAKKLRQVNPALFAKSEWAYTFRREWKGEQE